MMGRAFATLVGREWSRTWTTREGYYLRAGYAIILLISACIFVGYVGSGFRIGSDSLAEVVREFFCQFSLGQFLLVSLLATMAFTRSVQREKENETMDLLVVSPLRRVEILGGKVAGDYLAVLTVLVAGLPVLCFVQLFGGISFSEILATHLILAGQLAIVAGVALLLGVFLSNHYEVIILTWFIVFGLIVLPDAGPVFFPKPALLWAFLSELNLFHLLGQELRTVWIRMGPSLEAAATGMAFLIACCGAGSLFLDRQNALRRERGRRRGLLEPVRRDLRWLGSVKALTWMFPRGGGSRGSLFQREFSLRDAPILRGVWFFYALVYAATVALAVWLSQGQGHDAVVLHAIILGVVGGTVALLICVRTAISVSQARRDGTFEVLLAAGAEPVDIVSARLAGLLLQGAYWLAPPTLHAIGVAVAYGTNRSLVAAIFLGVLWLGLGLLSAVLFAMWLSMRSRSVLWALMGAVAFGVLFMVVAGFLAATNIHVAVLAVPLLIADLVAVYAWTVTKFRRNALRT